MKKIFKLLAVAALAALSMLAACSDDFILTEKTFFTVMKNVQYYPSNYIGKYLEFDCFTYDLSDAYGEVYRLGVRKCSAELGCTCGNDTIIGFILQYDGEIPAPVNQSGDDVEKTWVNLRGQLVSTDFTEIEIHSYDAAGNVVEGVNERVKFLTFAVGTLEIIEDYSNLNYYVIK
ncbi:MAG: hypothetical protein ACI4QI_02145 [Candidatus Coproplasma sp.]